MNRKIPPDAFEFYHSLGPGRSHQAVADRYGVTKRAVTMCAKREEWTQRLEEVERKARERSEKRILESIDEMQERHLKIIRVVQARALEAIKGMPIASAMDAARALDMTLRQERLIRGEPTDRSVLGIEDMVRREHERWVENGEAGGADSDDEE